MPGRSLAAGWRAPPWGSAPCRAARITYVGELGYELFVPAEQAAYVYDLVTEAG